MLRRGGHRVSTQMPCCARRRVASERHEGVSKAPRCGAKTRKGTACQAPAMRNGRCQFHGGKSTGPRTPEGIERIRRAATKHGWYSKAAKAERRRIRELVRACNAARADLKKRL